MNHTIINHLDQFFEELYKPKPEKKYKCLYCNNDCEIMPELTQLPNPFKKTGYYLSKCCAAEYLVYDDRDLKELQ